MEEIELKLRYAIMRFCREEWQLKEETIDFYNLVFILDGEGCYWVNDQCYPVSKNEVILIPKGAKRKARSTSMVLQSFDFWCPQTLPVFPQFVMPFQDAGFFQHAFHEFNRHWLFQSEFSALRCKALFYDILTTLFEQIFESGKNRHVVMMKRYIEKHYLETVTLDDMAWVTGLNEVYCGALFSKEEGITISRYVHQLRLRKAELLLLEEDLSITDIALQCGYEDVYYFSRIFRQIKGISPLKYRKQKRLGQSLSK